MVVSTLLFLVFSLALLFQPFIVLSIENIQVPKISPEHKLAAIKTPENTLKVINLGEALDTHTRVIDVMGGNIVIEVKTGRVDKTVIIRMQNAIQRVERFRDAGDASPLLYSSHYSKDKIDCFSCHWTGFVI